MNLEQREMFGSNPAEPSLSVVLFFGSRFSVVLIDGEGCHLPFPVPVEGDLCLCGRCEEYGF